MLKWRIYFFLLLFLFFYGQSINFHNASFFSLINIVGTVIASLNLLAIYSYAFNGRLVPAKYWYYYFYIFASFISFYVISGGYNLYRVYGAKVIPSIGISLVIMLVFMGPTAYVIYKLGDTKKHHH